MAEQENPSEETSSCCGGGGKEGVGDGEPCCPMMEMCQKCMLNPVCRYGYVVPGLALIACGVLVLVFPEILVWLLGITSIVMGVMVLVCGSMMLKMCRGMLEGCCRD